MQLARDPQDVVGVPLHVVPLPRQRHGAQERDQQAWRRDENPVLGPRPLPQRVVDVDGRVQHRVRRHVHQHEAGRTRPVPRVVAPAQLLRMGAQRRRVLLQRVLPRRRRRRLHRPPIGIERRLGVDDDAGAPRHRHHRVGPQPLLAARRHLLPVVDVPGHARRLDGVPQVLLAPRTAHPRVAQHPLQPARLLRQPAHLLGRPGRARRRRPVQAFQLLANRVDQRLDDGARALRLLRGQPAAFVDEGCARGFGHLRRNALE